MLSINELEALSVKVANDDAGFDWQGYGKAVGLGSGTGAIAGIPLGLLAHALMANEDSRGLRDYLKSGLIGGLVGTGVGGAAGAGLRAYMSANPESAAAVAKAIEGAKDKSNLIPGLSQFLGAAKGVSPQAMAAAGRNEIGIPGVTADSLGLPSFDADTLKNTGLNAVNSAFLR